MQLVKDFEVSDRFTKVPNDFFEPGFFLWEVPGALRLYLQLLSLKAGLHDVPASDMWQLLGMVADTYRKNLRALEERNLVVVDKKLNTITLTLPAGACSSEPAAAEEPREPEPEKLIAKEVAAKPKRKPTDLSREDRWERIKKAWNDNKPETYMSLKGALNLPLYLAIETHTASLEVDRDDYENFVGAVLRGAKADPWWAEKDFKATAVFGLGTELQDKKFENVEKLYKAGLATKPRVEKSSAFWSDDEQVIAWYKSNVDGAPADMRVERIKVENDTEAQDLEDWHAFTVLGQPTRDTEVFLYRRLQALFTSGKLNYSAERFKGAARLYYQEGKPNPIWWTSRQTMPQPPTEN